MANLPILNEKKSNDFSQKTRVFLINQNETSDWKILFTIYFGTLEPSLNFDTISVSHYGTIIISILSFIYIPSGPG